jgi:hypothetical protein
MIKALLQEKNIPIKEIILQVIDSDAKSKAWKFSFKDPIHGKVDQLRNMSNATASIAYKPNNNYTRPDDFTFSATNGTYKTDEAKISLVINPLNTNLLLVWTPEDRARGAFVFSMMIAYSAGIYEGISRYRRRIESGYICTMEYCDGKGICQDNFRGKLAFFWHCNSGKGANSQ